MGHRRAFLRDVAAAGAAAVVGASAAGAEHAVPIVDTHQHLWDLKRFHLGWIEKGSTLDRDYLLRDYLAATAGLGVEKAVYMEVDVVPEEQTTEADWVLELCRSKVGPTVAAVISGRPASDGFGAFIRRYRDAPEIQGVRQVLHGPGTPPGFCLQEPFLRGVRLLGELGKRFDICLRAAELGDAAKLADACPGTSFILDHCGNPEVRSDLTRWKADIARVAERRNVACKVSGFIASARGKAWTVDDLAPIVNHVLDAFGPDRVMFGGDWPVCTLAASYAEWVSALRTIVRGRSEEERRKLFRDNAVRVYRLA